MSSGVNKFIGVGNLAKDVECRYTQGGKAVATLRLAMSERVKDGDGWKDHAEFIDVVVWEQQAENASRYLRKGSQVYVEGKLQTRSYKDKEGHDRYKTEIRAFVVNYLGGYGNESKGSGSKPTPNQPAPADGGGFVDDDLPF